MGVDDPRNVAPQDCCDADVPDHADGDPSELRGQAQERVGEKPRQPGDPLDDERQVVGDDVAGGDRQEGRGIGTSGTQCAAGYVIAHYLTLVIQGVLWLPGLLVDLRVSVAPELTWIPVSAVWYLSVAAIVGGHIAGIVLAHRLSLLDSPGRATIAGLPMVALMIGYTILSLWIIAQPIVVEPGVQQAAFR